MAERLTRVPKTGVLKINAPSIGAPDWHLPTLGPLGALFGRIQLGRTCLISCDMTLITPNPRSWSPTTPGTSYNLDSLYQASLTAKTWSGKTQ
eukprot:scaffold169902_cov17-Tisochrysis_lutea.AAC.1